MSKTRRIHSMATAMTALLSNLISHAFHVGRNYHRATLVQQRWSGSAPGAPRILRRPLYAGIGVAATYSWHEEAFEIEVVVPVPKDTRVQDVAFRPSIRSIDLRLRQDIDVVLLDGNRTLRGRVDLDGTYWVLGDLDPTRDTRNVTVTIEKLLKTPADDFEVVDYDWKGVFVDDDELDNVTSRVYDEPEKLNVQEYAASMGVDIDNMNMSLVDTTMFSSGLNLTQSSMDELAKAGYLREITRQSDGKESVVDPTTGDVQAFDTYGPGVSTREARDVVVAPAPKIPFIDGHSPWSNAVPVVTTDKANNTRTILQQTRNFTRAAFAADRVATQQLDDKTTRAIKNEGGDAIENLTVPRLQDILQSQGLPTTGNKVELQARLRQRVNALLQGHHEEQSDHID